MWKETVSFQNLEFLNAIMFNKFYDDIWLERFPRMQKLELFVEKPNDLLSTNYKIFTFFSVKCVYVCTVYIVYIMDYGERLFTIEKDVRLIHAM